MIKRGVDEGELCNRPMNDAGDICDGTLELPPAENCYCHISPPCGSCLDRQLECTKCAWRAGDPEPEPMMYEHEGTRFWIEDADGRDFVEVGSIRWEPQLDARARFHGLVRSWPTTWPRVEIPPHLDPTQGMFNCRGEYVMPPAPPPSYPPEAWVETPRRIARRD